MVNESELEFVRSSIRSLNLLADLFLCQHSSVDITELLNIRAFDPSKNQALLLPQDISDPFTNSNKDNYNKFVIERDENGKITTKKNKNKRVNVSERAKKLMSSSASSEVSTVSLTALEAIDLHRFNVWISGLLQSQGERVFRLKGILHMFGFNHQFVVQGTL